MLKHQKQNNCFHHLLLPLELWSHIITYLDKTKNFSLSSLFTHHLTLQSQNTLTNHNKRKSNLFKDGDFKEWNKYITHIIFKKILDQDFFFFTSTFVHLKHTDLSYNFNN